MPTDHREIDFEDAIEYHLVKVAGYKQGDPANFDRKRGIDPVVFLEAHGVLGPFSAEGHIRAVEMTKGEYGLQPNNGWTRTFLGRCPRLR